MTKLEAKKTLGKWMSTTTWLTLFAVIVSPAIAVAAYSAVGSLEIFPEFQMMYTNRYSWEFEPTNERERAHLDAAKYLAELNFYEDGCGLVLPPSINRERIENVIGAERLVEMSGLIYENGRVYGISEEQFGETKLLVAGCAACHVGKAAGRVIPGLGNKTADFFGLVESVEGLIASASSVDAALHAGDSEWRKANDIGTQASSHISEHSEYDSGVAGAITQFFALEMAFEQAGLEPFDKPLYAPVKAPSMWGYGPKRQVGVFANAMLKGSPAGAAGIPLFIGNYDFNVFEKNMQTYEEAEHQFEQLLPPTYPFAVDQSKAAQGKAIYVDRCGECHGEHNRDADGLPLYVQPRFVDLEEVGTDPLRATAFDESAKEKFLQSPFAPYLHLTGNEPGYVAPNLWGVWSRFPYLHNGSVANLSDLLTSPESRPRYVDLKDIGEADRFDSDRLGATQTQVSAVVKRVQSGDRFVLDTTRNGFSNQGHDFGTDLSDEEKRALIEYLKTL